ncbi:hypothetical protein [Herbiconiux sp. YIM B11900]|uniref:hypothetical protein n=1 Tax=Herbiconiux sp. YIM B11900 TaxID=3404131 RepID=UPI003F844EF1
MTTPSDDDARLEPDDLDGHTLEELADYLAHGRSPRNPGIEGSAGCRLALDAMEHLQHLSWDALEHEARADPHRDDAWITQLLDTIKDEIRPGRDIPVHDPDPNTTLTLTEAAVRGLIRITADALPHVLVSRTEFDGDLSSPGAPVSVAITAAAEFGHPIEVLSAQLRDATLTALTEHTELVIDRIDVTFDDVYQGRTDA